MKTYIEEITTIKERQETIDALLESGHLTSDASEIGSKWLLTPLIQSEECSVGIVDVVNITHGPCKPHIHYNSKEYLVCVSGSFILNVNGSDVRTVHKGECAVIREGELHYSRPLEDNTRMIYVCVPADKNMRLLEERLSRKDG